MFKKTFLSLSCPPFGLSRSAGPRLRRVSPLTCVIASLALGAVAAPAFASSKFFLVVPLNAQAQAQEPVEAITVSLAGAALPKATVNKAYSESLRPYLSVTGDAAFDLADARWSLAEGALPAGLSLDAATGSVAGTPTTKTTSPASFTLLATYKGQDGQAVYTIEVGGEVLSVSKISAGSSHTCAVTDAGGVKCWGRNNVGQLGDNSTITRLVPVDVVGLTSGVVSVTASYYHSCALTTSGVAKCWGANSYGQLGDNSIAQRNAPVDVIGLEAGVVSIAASEYHTCAITTNSGVKCWGFNGKGQLGDNTITNRRTPVDVVGLTSGVRSLSTYREHTCVVLTSGAAKCWGYNGFGQFGDNSTTSQRTPVIAGGFESGVASIAAGQYHTCAVTTAGAAKCWGHNGYGQLGDNSKAQSLTPVDVVDLDYGVASIAAGQSHTCAITKTGEAKCWGYNGYGQLGDKSTTGRMTPVEVDGLTSGVISITAGGEHTCALTTAGTKCWGRSDYGQVGHNSNAYQVTPVDVQGSQ